MVKVMVAVVVAAALAIAVDPGLGEAVGIPLMLAGYIVASWLFVTGSASYSGRERIAWRLIGFSFSVAAVGILAFGIAYGLGHDIPAFGPLDIFFIVAYLTNLAGFWILPHLDGVPARRIRVFIDGLVGALSLALISWVWFLSDILDRVRDASPLEFVIGSTYPIVDVAALIVVTVVTLRRSTLRFDPRVLLIGAGFVAQAVADIIYLREGLGQSFATVEPVYPLFLLAVAAFMTAGLTLGSKPPEREYAERRTPWWAMIAPYGAAVALISTLALRMANETQDLETLELFVGSIVVVTLIILRQGIAIRENRELVERQRSALVSSISHELRTPLTAMVGFLDILNDPDQQMDDDSRTEMLDIVHQQTTYMARIVADLVMLNRAQPDLQLAAEVVDARSLATAATASLDIEAAPGIEIEVDRHLRALVDPGRVQQILVNLLTNAVRYGGPRRLLVITDRDGDLLIEVHDDGPGVPKRFEYAIWERFERGVHRYDAGVPGSGIGLAIVLMLTKAHGGSVDYRRSERLGGACFSVVLEGRSRPRLPDHVSVGGGRHLDP